MDYRDWMVVGIALWAVATLIFAMVLEFKSGSKRVVWPSPERVFQPGRYSGGSKILYRAFVVWCVVGVVAASLGIVAILVSLIIGRLGAIG